MATVVSPDYAFPYFDEIRHVVWEVQQEADNRILRQREQLHHQQG